MCRGGAQGQRNHRPEMPLAPMQVLKQYCGDGAITNDKFCWVRRTQLRLSWSRLALCSRPAYAADAPAESLLARWWHATPVERTAAEIAPACSTAERERGVQGSGGLAR